MPRRKKGRDKTKGKKRNRRKKQLPDMNTRPHIGPKDTYTPIERKPWEQRRQPHEGRTMEDMILHNMVEKGIIDPASLLAGEEMSTRKVMKKK